MGTEIVKWDRMLQEQGEGGYDADNLPAVRNVSSDYINGRSLLESKTPEELMLMVIPERAGIGSRPISPRPGWAYIVKEEGRPLQVINFGEQDYYAKRFRRAIIYSVYAGQVNHGIMFSLPMRVQNLGTNARVSLTYRVSDPVACLRADALGSEFINPFVFERANDLISRQQDSSNLNNPGEFNPEDFREMNDALRNELKGYLLNAGITLHGSNLVIIPSPAEAWKWKMRESVELQNYRLEGMRRLGEIQMEQVRLSAQTQGLTEELQRRNQSVQREYQRTQEILDATNQNAIAGQKRDFEFDTHARYNSERLRIIGELRTQIAELEKSLMGTTNLPAGLNLRQYIETILHLGMQAAGNSQSQAELQGLLNQVMAAEVDNLRNPLEVKKILARRGLFGKVNLGIRTTDQKLAGGLTDLLEEALTPVE